MKIEDFNRESNFNISLEGVDTLGGFIFSHVNRVPCIGEVIKISNKYQFEILDADPRKIKKIRISNLV
tara:strand:+ start:259 stop:462 length:204 start_codon:yes stop_codon:yes gene_type:complete